MDIATIKTHLDNFVLTWDGWGYVFKGLNDLFGEDGALQNSSQLNSSNSGLLDLSSNFSSES